MMLTLCCSHGLAQSAWLQGTNQHSWYLLPNQSIDYAGSNQHSGCLLFNESIRHWFCHFYIGLHWRKSQPAHQLSFLAPEKSRSLTELMVAVLKADLGMFGFSSSISFCLGGSLQPLVQLMLLAPQILPLLFSPAPCCCVTLAAFTRPVNQTR